MPEPFFKAVRERILRSFTIDEISAVDKPAQTLARVRVMKREDDSKPKGESRMNFEQQVEDLVAKGSSRTAAMSKARLADGQAFDSYQRNEPLAKRQADADAALAKRRAYRKRTAEIEERIADKIATASGKMSRTAALSQLRESDPHLWDDAA